MQNTTINIKTGDIHASNSTGWPPEGTPLKFQMDMTGRAVMCYNADRSYSRQWTNPAEVAALSMSLGLVPFSKVYASISIENEQIIPTILPKQPF